MTVLNVVRPLGERAVGRTSARMHHIRFLTDICYSTAASSYTGTHGAQPGTSDTGTVQPSIVRPDDAASFQHFGDLADRRKVVR